MTGRAPNQIVSDLPCGAGDLIPCAELAGLPCADLPRGKFPNAKIQRAVARLGIATFEMTVRGGVALAVHIADLPADTRAAIVTARRGVDSGAPETDQAAWRWFAGISPQRQARAELKLRALLAIEGAIDAGKTLTLAVAEAAVESGQAPATIHRDRAKVRELPRVNWLPALARQSSGGAPRAEISDAALGFFVGFLREAADRCPLTLAHEKTAMVAKRNRWAWPSYSTISAWWSSMPAGERALIRSGAKAHDATIPTQRRSIAHFQAMEIVNLDGRTADVFVEFEDGTIGRPVVIAIQDIYSRAFLGWTVAATENSDATKTTILKVIDRFGVFGKLVTDNGRAFASKKISGGAPHRFRGKTEVDEVSGILELIGATVQFTKPYSGRSKPIERGFRDMAQRIDTLPEFKGAYCGNRPGARPEDFEGRAVPIAKFRAVYDREIASHNAKPGRRTEACQGKLSFDAAFAASYRQRPARPVTAAQRRYFMFDIVYLRPQRDTGALASQGFRWWSPEHQPALLKHRNSKVRVLLDPSDRSADVIVEDLKGRVIVDALPCIHDGKFDSTELARTHNRARAQLRKADRAAIKARNIMTGALVAQHLRAAEAATETAPMPAPATGNNLVAPAFKAPRIRSPAAAPSPAQEEFSAKAGRAIEQFGQEMIRRRIGG